MIKSLIPSLNRLAQFLIQEKICVDPSPLQNALHLYNNSLVVSELKLSFSPSDLRNVRPKKTYKQLYVILNVSLSDIDTNDKKIVLDFERYLLQFEIHAIDDSGNDNMASWHLDYDNTGKAEFVHPYFHLTFGGNAIEDRNLGDLLLLPCPRIPYPPMDVIMAIDFILANFLKKEKYFRIRSEYAPFLKKSQEWLLRPYILSIANNWCKFGCQNYNNPLGYEVALIPYLVS